MANDFKVPNLGENVEEGDIVKVMVSEGDEIAADQNVMEIETGKAVVELPCPFAGKVVKVHVKEGSKVKVGDSLLTVEGADGKATAKTAPAKKETPAAKAEPEPTQGQAEQPEAEPEKEVAQVANDTEAPKPASAPAAKSAPQPMAPTSAPTATPGKTPPAGPATRRLARELGVDLTIVAGTGPHGRITEEDVKAAVREHAAAPRGAAHVAPGAPLPAGTDERDSWGIVRRSKVTAIRKAIAVNMAASHSTIPHVTNFDDADITELERIRKGGLADYVGTDIKLTMMPFVMKAVAQALRLHPLVNASIDMAKEEIVYKQYVNIGVAVDTERGLVVPVIRDVDRLSIPAIAKALTETTEKARKAQFKLDDLKGGTFTISNLGAVGGTYSTPIINPPEVAVLLLGRSRKLPIIGEGDKIDIRLMMPLSLSYDHRLVDGATAARFLNEVISYLKVPGRLLLAP
jgi:pyruvate/2-oxoglutarate dehydrogenase complex dihydrolipoamide acyltransferase (E2) component